MCGFAQFDYNSRCSSGGRCNNVIPNGKQGRSWSACAHAQADLDLRCLHMSWVFCWLLWLITLTFTALGTSSEDHKLITFFFLIFPRKQDLKFHAKYFHWWQCAWNAKPVYWKKVRKIFKISTAEILPWVLSFNQRTNIIWSVGIECSLLNYL